HHDLALARAVAEKAAVFAIFAAVGRLHIAAEIAAVDFRPLALATDRGLANLRSHRFAELVSENEGALVGRAQVTAKGQHGLAFNLIHEDRDGEEVRAERHLATGEDRSACEAEIFPTRLALEAQ